MLKKFAIILAFVENATIINKISRTKEHVITDKYKIIKDHLPDDRVVLQDKIMSLDEGIQQG